MRIWVILLALAAATPSAAKSQTEAPSLTSVVKTPSGKVYATKNRKTLYSLSLRTAYSRWGRATDFCNPLCKQNWTPFLAAPDAKPAGNWSTIDTAQGKQWAYDRNPVFAFNQDRKPGDIKGDGFDDLFATLTYSPPVPKLIAPPAVSAKLMDDAFVLTNARGELLVTGTCSADCAPLLAGAASLPIGAWTVVRDRDTARWAWNGKPVFVSSGGSQPKGAKTIRP